MILHIPHHSTVIPKEYRDLFVISDEQLAIELQLMTDHDTDKMFSIEHPDITSVMATVSRLLVDNERFREDTQESMSEKGMGAIYTLRQDGTELKKFTEEQKETLLTTFYDPHHKALKEAVQNELDANGQSLIIDCHSFPNKPLPYEKTQETRNVDFCLGFDDFHAPRELIVDVCRFLEIKGYSYQCNYPFSGSIVPNQYYKKDQRVSSLMIEVNRDLDTSEVKLLMDALLPYLAGDKSKLPERDFDGENICTLLKLDDWAFEEGEVYIDELHYTPSDNQELHEECIFKSMEVICSSPSCLSTIQFWMEVVINFTNDKKLHSVNVDMIGGLIDRAHSEETIIDGCVYILNDEVYSINGETSDFYSDEANNLQKKLVRLIQDDYQLIMSDKTAIQFYENRFMELLSLEK